MTVSGQVHFDARGRIDETGQPTFVTVATPSHVAGSQAETFTSAPPLRSTLIDYDTLGRIVRVEIPDGSVTSSGYSIGLLDVMIAEPWPSSPFSSTRPSTTWSSWSESA